MNKKIKVFSLTTAYPESVNSIRHQFVHTVNKELVKLGLSVKTITPHLKGSLTTESMDSVIIKRFKYLPENCEINEDSIADLVTTRFGFFKVWMMAFIFFVYTFFECLKERPDILHGHWAFPGGLVAILMAKIFRKKSVVTLHGGIALLKKFKFLKKLLIFYLNQSSLIITNSNYTKNKFVELGVQHDKMKRVFVPPNFVEIVDDQDALNFRNTIVDSDTKIILYVGRLAEYKGLEYLISSISKIKNHKVHLLVVGYGPLLDKLKSFTKSMELENKITFIIGPSHKKLGMIHSISDVFVLPSIVDSRGETEGLGLVILEAMKSGIPVIASSVGGIVDIIDHEVNGLLVEPKNPFSIANGIERLLSETNLAKRIISNSKNTLIKFLPETIGREHREIYKNLLT